MDHFVTLADGNFYGYCTCFQFGASGPDLDAVSDILRSHRENDPHHPPPLVLSEDAGFSYVNVSEADLLV
jgi:hypothetical protein